MTTIQRCTWYGCTRKAPKGFKRCAICRASINRRLRALVAHRRRLGLCKCGARRAPKRKSCRKCLDYFLTRQVELMEQRYIDGNCVICGSPKLAVRTYSTGERRTLKVCEGCRKNRASVQRETWNEQTPARLVRMRKKQAARRSQAHAKRICTECRKPAFYDATKGKFRRLCRGHLDALNARVKRWSQRHIELGHCGKCGGPAIYDSAKQAFLTRCKRHR